VYPYVYRQHYSHCHHTGHVYPYVYRPHCSQSPNRHVYPYVYRPHYSHCHPLATCIHMCIGRTAATVTLSPRVSICLSAALQPLSHTGHMYPYVYRQHYSHCHPHATCIHMCIASTTGTVTHSPHVSICVSPALQPLSPTCHVPAMNTSRQSVRRTELLPLPNDTAVQDGACLLTGRKVCLASFGTASVTRRSSCTA